MKISEAIERLKMLLEAHGDLPLHVLGTESGSDAAAAGVEVCDKGWERAELVARVVTVGRAGE